MIFFVLFEKRTVDRLKFSMKNQKSPPTNRSFAKVLLELFHPKCRVRWFHKVWKDFRNRRAKLDVRWSTLSKCCKQQHKSSAFHACDLWAIDEVGRRWNKKVVWELVSNFRSAKDKFDRWSSISTCPKPRETDVNRSFLYHKLTKRLDSNSRCSNRRKLRWASSKNKLNELLRTEIERCRRRFRSEEQRATAEEFSFDIRRALDVSNSPIRRTVVAAIGRNEKLNLEANGEFESISNEFLWNDRVETNSSFFPCSLNKFRNRFEDKIRSNRDKTESKCSPTECSNGKVPNYLGESIRWSTENVAESKREKKNNDSTFIGSPVRFTSSDWLYRRPCCKTK